MPHRRGLFYSSQPNKYGVAGNVKSTMEQLKNFTFDNVDSLDNFSSNVKDIITQAGNHTDDKMGMEVFMATLILIFMPGFLSNLLALFFIILDIKNISSPLLVLLLVLIISDLLAVSFSLVRHLLFMYLTPSYELCASIAFMHSFFKLMAGCVNSMMAVDRVLAISTPFFYERRITVNTWRVGCIIAAVITAGCSIMPSLGLGIVILENEDGLVECAGFYSEIPLEKVFPIIYSSFGFTFIGIIVTSNAILITNLLKISKRRSMLTRGTVRFDHVFHADDTTTQQHSGDQKTQSESSYSSDPSEHAAQPNYTSQSNVNTVENKNNIYDQHMEKGVIDGNVSDKAVSNGCSNTQPVKEDTDVKNPRKVAFEIAFAQLMFRFATAYLICGSPNYVSSVACNYNLLISGYLMHVY